MKTNLFAVALAVIVASLAFGATPKTRAIPHQSSETFEGTSQVTFEKAPQLPMGIATWDFPALGGNQVTCSDSATLALPSAVGAKYGSGCIASTDWGQDGGSVALYFRASVSCYAVTDGCVFRACNFSSDGGTPGPIDLPDSGLFCRIVK